MKDITDFNGKTVKRMTTHERYDHIVIEFTDGTMLRFTPRWVPASGNWTGYPDIYLEWKEA